MMFKAGDVVQLKSGGQLMTVTEVSVGYSYSTQPEEYQRVSVVWCNKNKDLCFEDLKEILLEKVE